MAETKANPAQAVLHELEPKEVLALLEKHECLLIDVREPGEFEAERIPDAMLYPLSEFDASAIPFDGKRRIILQCGTGKRSAKAAGLAHQAGISDVTHLKGGLQAWKAAGMPVIAYDPSTGQSRERSA
ncbi:rhodanese-like domain-containing protein [Hyphococcus luteus]|uniref:Sulfurtransferase n=1 Tax=Hyphococcus luteus TaxID=2058213 RepID=A0A2S7KAN0_9PROT|nr:rhodanese-like domain-containing protein [Marinicaulis flavus]PQA89528.1 sulfurtransferase [Marinicaulis flavus]